MSVVILDNLMGCAHTMMTGARYCSYNDAWCSHNDGLCSYNDEQFSMTLVLKATDPDKEY